MNNTSYKEIDISKKLLSKVLDVSKQIINKVYINYNKIIISFYEAPANDIKEVEINIYELAHKCKEWAYKQGYIVQANYENTIQGKMCRVSMSKIYSFYKHGNWFYSTCRKTEPEAIFKACEWILKQKEI